jgi:hypothetical protein
MTKKDYDRLSELQSHKDLFMTSEEFSRCYFGAYRWDKKEQIPEYEEVNAILKKELDGFGQFYNFCLQEIADTADNKNTQKVVFVRYSINYSRGTDNHPFYGVAYTPLTDFKSKK